MIKNIVFDFGQVLVNYDFNIFLKTIISDEQERSRFAAVVCGDEYVNRFDKGDQSFTEIIREAQQIYPQWHDALQQFHDSQLNVLTGEVPGMRELIVRLKSAGYRVLGLSNWSETVYPVIEKFQILQMIEERIISSEEKIIKPDPAIYRRLLEKFSLKAEESLFTDDKQKNVDGALSVGMEAVLFKNAAQFEEELRRRGVEV